MRPDQDLAQLTGELFLKLDPVVKQLKPDWILAQGDTTTVLVTALVAFYNRVRFGHVEAGLRAGDRYNPFPEEINRCLADSLADVHFAPTKKNRQTLIREGRAAERVIITGNTVIDALLAVANLPYDWSQSPLSHIPRTSKLILVTVHRRESFGKPLREIFSALKELARKLEADGVHFVYPVHMNPNVRQPAHEFLSGLDNMDLIEPLDYLSFVHLMKRSILILTDSGGIQEEAPSFGIPVLVMRKTTERSEAIDAGTVKLVGTCRSYIIEETVNLMADENLRTKMTQKENPYGDGRAARRIVNFLRQQPL
jgi:UDP-N-acetylglucosamine 2-epimerase